MSWRKYKTQRGETKAVKDALKQAGYTVIRVGHGRGTAWGWLDVTIKCPKGMDRLTDRHKVIKFLMEVTGRHGDYSGRIALGVIDW